MRWILGPSCFIFPKLLLLHTLMETEVNERRAYILLSYRMSSPCSNNATLIQKYIRLFPFLIRFFIRYILYMTEICHPAK